MVITHIQIKQVAYIKHTSFCSISWIYDIGNGCLLIILFNFLRFARDLKKPSGLEIVNLEDVHLNLIIFLDIPYLHDLSNFLLSFFLGIVVQGMV